MTVKPIKERLPPTRNILEQAIEEILKEYKVESLSELVERFNVSDIVVKLEKKANKIYRDLERQAVKSYLIDKGLSPKDAEKITELILHENNLTKEISNIRRARAGKTVEEILMRILRAHNIPCERGRKIRNYRPDVVIPDNATLSTKPEKAVAIAVKRTLRERWAEDIDVFRFPHGMFVLITPDPDFNEGKAQDMINRGMKEIYIPDELYESSPFLNKYPEFKKLSSLPSQIRKIIE